MDTPILIDGYTVDHFSEYCFLPPDKLNDLVRLDERGFVGTVFSVLGILAGRHPIMLSGGNISTDETGRLVEEIQDTQIVAPGYVEAIGDKKAALEKSEKYVRDNWVAVVVEPLKKLDRKYRADLYSGHILRDDDLFEVRKRGSLDASEVYGDITGVSLPDDIVSPLVTRITSYHSDRTTPVTPFDARVKVLRCLKKHFVTAYMHHWKMGAYLPPPTRAPLIEHWCEHLDGRNDALGTLNAAIGYDILHSCPSRAKMIAFALEYPMYYERRKAVKDMFGMFEDVANPPNDRERSQIAKDVTTAYRARWGGLLPVQIMANTAGRLFGKESPIDLSGSAQLGGAGDARSTHEVSLGLRWRMCWHLPSPRSYSDCVKLLYSKICKP